MLLRGHDSSWEGLLTVLRARLTLSRHGPLFLALLALCFGLGCAGGAVDPPTLNCSFAGSTSAPTSLPTYDQYSASFLSEDTKNPTTNGSGEVVWGTRYYLESLLTAYETTKNVKYLRAFEDTGTAVMNLVQTQTFLDVPDPSAPGQPATGPYLSRTGWPTYAATLGAAIAIPTATGQVALYAQSLYPAFVPAAYYVVITGQPDGTLQFNWVAY